MDPQAYLKKISSPLDLSSSRIAIVLAAGHGKRLRSNIPKMLFEIWGVPTIIRVIEAVEKGLDTLNQIIVVGQKWKKIVDRIGTRKHRVFAFQEVQQGTGDAVKSALKEIPEDFSGDVYIFPGDMGLIDSQTIQEFREKFDRHTYDLLLLTGEFEGTPEENYYGRVICNGEQVMGIVEFKDIISLSSPMSLGGKTFSKEELLKIREFNAGVYAFRLKPLKQYIHDLKPDNVQKEYYLTDLIKIFREKNLSVGRMKVEDEKVILGFNDRVVLKKMNRIAREKVYAKLKNIVNFEDPDDFFLSENVVLDILFLADKGPVDIFIGQGVHVGKEVKLSRGVRIRRNSFLEGNIHLGENVRIGENVRMTTYPGQELIVEKNVEILAGDIIKGRVRIGEGSRIESWVRITGSDKHPVKIGKKVLIKGTTYIYGCEIEDSVEIENCILKMKKVKRITDEKGKVKRIRYIIPPPEGEEALEEL